MKYFIYLFIGFFIFFLISCSNSKDEEQVVEGIYNGIGLDLSVVNSFNEDLLDPQHTDSYNVEEIRLFHIIDGKKIAVYNANLDNPTGVYHFNQENSYWVELLLNSDKSESFPTTLIKWNEYDIDTVKIKVERTEYSIVQSKVWLNDKLILDKIINGPLYYILKK